MSVTIKSLMGGKISKGKKSASMLMGPKIKKGKKYSSSKKIFNVPQRSDPNKFFFG